MISFSVPVQNGSFKLQLCAANPFCFGIDWDISIGNASVLTLDSTNSSSGPVSYDAVFNLVGVGETEVTVKATYGSASSIEKTYTIQVTDGNGDDGSGNEFSTFAELKQMISSDEDISTFAYTGESELVITEDLELPRNKALELNGKSLCIASGAVLTIGEDAFVQCKDLKVEGAIETAGMIALDYPGTIAGLERISFAQEWNQIEIHVTADGDSLAGYLEQLSSNHIENEHVKYHIFVRNENAANEALTLNQSITIPEYVTVYLGEPSSFTVAEGVSISLNGSIIINVPFILNGTLENNGSININHDEYSNGSLTVGANGSYSGNGGMDISSRTVSQLTDVISGISLDDFDVQSETQPDGWVYWNLKYVAGLTKLGTPVDLSWGTRYDYDLQYDASSDKMIITGYNPISQPGIMSWKTVLPDQAQAKVVIYNAADNQPVADIWCGFDPQLQPEYRSIEDFALKDLESGDYYFTVQSMADYKTYRNSDIAESGTYHYVKPSAKLSPCTDLHWADKNDEFVSWAQYQLPTVLSGSAGYEIDFFYSPTENGDYEYFGGVFSSSPDGIPSGEEPLEDHFLQEKGVGYYKFRVRLISTNIEAISNSEWSELSPALDVKTIPDGINADLDAIISDPNVNTPQDVRNAVQSLDTTDLKTALVTDQDNTKTTKKLKELEDKVGGPAAVIVTPGASAFKQSEVSIVGANLNTNTSENPDSNPITLIVDKPVQNHVIPELYNSSVAVRFSMTLQNVKNPKALEVPVKITLPVPESINPEFLVILHYHLEGSHELIRPYVHQVGGKYYADFVLTSFSDFIMTQMNQEDSGNVYPGTAQQSSSHHSSALAASAATKVMAANTGDRSMLFPWLLLASCSLYGIWLFLRGLYKKSSL